MALPPSYLPGAGVVRTSSVSAGMVTLKLVPETATSACRTVSRVELVKYSSSAPPGTETALNHPLTVMLLLPLLWPETPRRCCAAS